MANKQCMLKKYHDARINEYLEEYSGKYQNFPRKPRIVGTRGYFQDSWKHTKDTRSGGDFLPMTTIERHSVGIQNQSDTFQPSGPRDRLDKVRRDVIKTLSNTPSHQFDTKTEEGYNEIHYKALDSMRQQCQFRKNNELWLERRNKYQRKLDYQIKSKTDEIVRLAGIDKFHGSNHNKQFKSNKFQQIWMKPRTFKLKDNATTARILHKRMERGKSLREISRKSRRVFYPHINKRLEDCCNLHRGKFNSNQKKLDDLIKMYTTHFIDRLYTFWRLNQETTTPIKALARSALDSSYASTRLYKELSISFHDFNQSPFKILGSFRKNFMNGFRNIIVERCFKGTKHNNPFRLWKIKGVLKSEYFRYACQCRVSPYAELSGESRVDVKEECPHMSYDSHRVMSCRRKVTLLSHYIYRLHKNLRLKWLVRSSNGSKLKKARLRDFKVAFALDGECTESAFDRPHNWFGKYFRTRGGKSNKAGLLSAQQPVYYKTDRPAENAPDHSAGGCQWINDQFFFRSNKGYVYNMYDKEFNVKEKFFDSIKESQYTDTCNWQVYSTWRKTFSEEFQRIKQGKCPLNSNFRDKHLKDPFTEFCPFMEIDKEHCLVTKEQTNNLANKFAYGKSIPMLETIKEKQFQIYKRQKTLIEDKSLSEWPRHHSKETTNSVSALEPVYDDQLSVIKSLHLPQESCLTGYFMAINNQKMKNYIIRYIQLGNLPQ